MLENLEILLPYGDSYAPVRANPTDAGLDLKSRVTINLSCTERTLVPTGVYVKIPVGYVGLLIPRSSLSKNGVMLANSVGVIDSDYRGEIMAALISHNNDEPMINEGDRIVQLLIVPIALPTPIVAHATVEDWAKTTNRGIGGFGSTGK